MDYSIKKLQDKIEELHGDTNNNPYSHIGRLQNKISQLHGEDIDGRFISRTRLRDRHTFRSDRVEKVNEPKAQITTEKAEDITQEVSVYQEKINWQLVASFTLFLTSIIILTISIIECA